MKKSHLKIIFLEVVLLTAIGCDLDKYIGYDYKAESIIATVQISGTVNNIFTGLPVKNALVRFGEEETYSFLDGSYLIVYPLGTDEERNKSILVTVTAENYYVDSSQTIIYPEDKEYNFQLVYAAPIIESSSLTATSDSAICHTIIFDYQGISDIAFATTTFSYLKWPNTATRAMQLDTLLTENRGVYRSSIALFDNEIGGINTTIHKITVFDKEGFSDSETFY